MTTQSLAASPNPASQLRLALSMAIPALLPGDIIATGSASVASRGIRAATDGHFSHAILYWADGRGSTLPLSGAWKNISSRENYRALTLRLSFVTKQLHANSVK